MPLPPVPSRPLVLTMGQAARELQISRSKAYDLAAAGKLPVIRVGSSMRVVRAALEEMVLRQLQEATTNP